MITKREIHSWLENEPVFDDIMCSLRAAPRLPKGMVKEARKVIAIARKFNQEIVVPYALDLDQTLQRDPEYLAWDLVQKAGEWGFYTMWLPKIAGGKGYSLPTLSYFLEEIGSKCLAIANLIGVHYLGVSTLFATWDTRLINEVLWDVSDGEKAGDPRLISLAITEPGAGTDVEEVDLLDQGTVACHAKKVDGGYVVNGTKVFISNGHLSKWHMLVAYCDLKHPAETTIVFAVKTGMDGFTFGRKEHKMGQKGCPASELIFKDCFIPREYAVASDHTANVKRSYRETVAQYIDYVVSTSRAGVAAMGVGVARGAFETALEFAVNTTVDGKLLVNHEWVQCLLAEMYKNVSMGRLTYVETNYANGLEGMFKILQYKPVYYLVKLMHMSVAEKIIKPILGHPIVNRLFLKLQLDLQTDAEIQRTSGWASLAKFACTDLGVKNCQMGVEIMGQAGLRHDQRIEKMLRDAKLLQIYEGTNQLNRVNLFKSLIGRAYPNANVFAHE